ncbi:hypothetical protein TNCT_264941 [Trichonephila clavata]|uniref:Uncharacterized protein n=1 Tax=Trichonephila clavata TaxID=2740835 RepID=A0A8X6HFC4_TRICU|nr:hypothetical protein TNCT_264941 [Trichonephila clavata]
MGVVVRYSCNERPGVSVQIPLSGIRLSADVSSDRDGVGLEIISLDIRLCSNLITNLQDFRDTFTCLCLVPPLENHSGEEELMDGDKIEDES